MWGGVKLTKAKLENVAKLIILVTLIPSLILQVIFYKPTFVDIFNLSDHPRIRIYFFINSKTQNFCLATLQIKTS